MPKSVYKKFREREENYRKTIIGSESGQRNVLFVSFDQLFKGRSIITTRRKNSTVGFIIPERTEDLELYRKEYSTRKVDCKLTQFLHNYEHVLRGISIPRLHGLTNEHKFMNKQSKLYIYGFFIIESDHRMHIRIENDYVILSLGYALRNRIQKVTYVM